VSAGDESEEGGLDRRHDAEDDLQALSMMGYDAVALGEKEFSHGLDFLTKQIAKHPFLVSSNVVWAENWLPLARTVRYNVYRLKAAPGRPAAVLRVAILGFLTTKRKPDVDRYLGRDAARVLILDPIVEAKKQVAKARHNANLVVVLAHMDEEQAKELVRQVPGIDVLVIGDMQWRTIVVPMRLNGTLIVANSNTGRRVGSLTVALDAKGRIESTRGGEQVIGQEFPEDPEVAEALAKIAQARTGQVSAPSPQPAGP
jgi:2',3'-cyclic-nucleotide 2'-phosphodiesterase (5'-nucleotidase family)